MPNKGGYNGGISLQEMVVPICILTAGESPAGYRLAGPSFPDWWECVAPPTVAELNRQAATRAVAAQPRKPKKAATLDGRQKHLFDDEAALEPLPSTAEDWIGPVLASCMFQSQKQLAARAALKDGEIRNLLEALAERGGQDVQGRTSPASGSAIAAHIGIHQCEKAAAECRPGQCAGAGRGGRLHYTQSRTAGNTV